MLVIEQGTILGRIDFNIEESLQHAKKGKAHLVEAMKASESTRARNVMLWLAAFIILFLVLYILKKS